MANPTHYQGDLRQTLVTAAIDLVREEGLAGLSLRAVAKRAGVSHAAPAHHVNDRAGLIAAVALEAHRLMTQAIGSAAAEAPTAHAALIAGVEAYIDFGMREPHLYALLYGPQWWDGHDALAAVLADGLSQTEETVAAAQAEGWAPGRSSRALATAVWSLAHGVVTLSASGALPTVARIDSAALLELLSQGPAPRTAAIETDER